MILADTYGVPPDPFALFLRRVIEAVACAVLGMLPVERSTWPLRREAWTA